MASPPGEDNRCGGRTDGWDLTPRDDFRRPTGALRLPFPGDDGGRDPAETEARRQGRESCARAAIRIKDAEQKKNNILS